MTTLAFLGNCQAESIAEIYNSFVAPSCGSVARYVPDYLVARDDTLEMLGSADIVVRLLMEPAAKDPFEHLLAGREIHLVPFVNAGWLWPHHGTPHPHRDRFRYNTVAMLDCSNAYLNRLVLKGVDPAGAVGEYGSLAASDFAGLERRYEIQIEKQMERDRLTGFASADFIADHFRVEPTFLTPFHPTLALSRYIALTCFERIGVKSEHCRIVAKFMSDSFYPKLEVPIHPAVARHFGLQFVTHERRYQWFNAGPITFDQYIVRYMAWDTNDTLESGLALAGSGEHAKAIPHLLGGLERSPESGAGHAALIEALLALGKIDDALTRAQMAIERVPQDWRLQRLCGVCFAMKERHDEAIPMYRAALGLNKGVFQTYMDLSYSLWHARRYEDALEAVGIGLEIKPHDSDALLRQEAIRRDLPAEQRQSAEQPKRDWREGMQFLNGWHEPEGELIWCGGQRSSLRLPSLTAPFGFAVEFDVSPFVHPGVRDSQQLQIHVGTTCIGSVSLSRSCRVAFVVPTSLAKRQPVVLEWSHPDSIVPAALDLAMTDTRNLALALHGVRTWLLGPQTVSGLRGSSRLKLSIPDRNDHDGARLDVGRRFAVSADKLVVLFESLGVDCEFGLLQRDCGAEPLGLLRFSSVFLEPLLRALDEDFAHLMNLADLTVTTDPSGEFIVSHRGYQLRYHTFLYADQTDAAAVIEREGVRLPFLLRKLREDLAEGAKCFVYKSFDSASAPFMLPLLLRLQALNAGNMVLCVTSTSRADLVGSVEEMFPGLLVGYVDRLTIPQPGQDGRSTASWLEVCLNARAIMQARL